MASEQRFVELEQSTLYVESDGAGDPVLLLHGLGLDLRMWGPQVSALRQNFRVIRCDLHGFGKSSAVEGAFSHSEILASLLDRLEIERVHLVGHSMGGRIAAEFVQSRPDRALSLTLASADVGGVRFASLGPKFGTIFELGRQGDIAAAKRAFLELEIFDATRRQPEAFEALSRMVSDYSGWLFAHAGDGLELRPAPPTYDVLDRFRLPALVIVGALDASDFDTIADRVIERLPGAEKRVLPDAGHMANLEQPEHFNAALLEFLGVPHERGR
jgi:pimeloyl-ACP methyl ester carboxylesterase